MSATLSDAKDTASSVSDESREQPSEVERTDKQKENDMRGRKSAKGEKITGASRSSSPASSVDTEQDGPIGESADIVEVYKARHGNWSTDKPKSKAKLHIPRDRAIVVRHQESDNGTWQMHSITIRSPHIRKLLAVAFKGYPGIDMELEDMTFKAPFNELFFRWGQFLDLMSCEEDEKVLEHCNLLIDTMKDTLQHQLDRAADLSKRGLIEYDYLWTLFEPGTEVYSNVDEHHRLYVVDESYAVNGDQNEQKFVVNARFIDFDGTRLGFDTSKREINPFKGVKQITELLVYPSSTNKNITAIRAQLDSQGRKFLAHCGLTFVQYTGYCLEYDEFNADQNRKPKWIDGERIVVDTKGWVQHNVSQTPYLDPISRAVRTRARSNSDGGNAVPPPIPILPFPGHTPVTFEISSQAEPDLDIPAHLVKYCAPFVRGFNLRTKKWVACFVDGVQPIDWNDRAFEKLLLRQQYKDMILAFMQSHIQKKDQFDDIIKGKGQGFVMLLEGEAGVGKTLTAESIAEQMHRPLYSLSAGELGINIYDIDNALRRVLNLCAKWHAVLLVDECDVFLEHRSKSDLERNKLVAVFLRLLEYYAGVMILTTNRASSIDTAFQSRIHLTINYPKLDTASRKQIWQTFTDPREPSEKHYSDNPISNEQLTALAKLDLNGREIKSVARSARLLAAKDEIPMGYEHVQAVLDVKKGSKGKQRFDMRLAGAATFLLAVLLAWLLYGGVAGNPVGLLPKKAYN